MLMILIWTFIEQMDCMINLYDMSAFDSGQLIVTRRRIFNHTCIIDNLIKIYWNPTLVSSFPFVFLIPIFKWFHFAVTHSLRKFKIRPTQVWN